MRPAQRRAMDRLFQNSSFGPREIARMRAAYEAALAQMRIEDREDPCTETIALRVLHCVRSGEESVPRIVQIVTRDLVQPPQSRSA